MSLPAAGLFPANTIAITESFANLESLEDLRLLMNRFRDPAYTPQILFPAEQPKALVATIWREYAAALSRFPLNSWNQLLPFLILADFVGSLRVYGDISKEEQAAARRRVIYAQNMENGVAIWLTGLTLTSLYDEDMVDYLKYSVIWKDPQLRPVTLTWMSMAWTANGTLTAAQKRNREFLFEALTQHAEETARFIPQAAFLDAYWTSDPVKYAGLRAAFTRWAAANNLVEKKKLPPRPSRSRPKIGIVSANWRPQHSARKALLTSVQQLRTWADVFLVDTNLHQDSILEDFDGRIPVSINPDPDHPDVSRVDDGALIAAELDILYYIETFQAELDALMALRRYAPVQATGYGIPVTTKSPNMDWFIGGRLVEGKGFRDYSEQVYLTPGIGMHSQRRPDGPAAEKRPGELRVVVAANLLKLTTEYLETLGRMAQAVPEAHWVLLPNASTVAGLWANERIAEYLPADRLQCYARTSGLYLPLLRSADLMLDAYPYSGYTTIVDAISTGTPVLTWRGQHAHERTAAAVAKLGGMPERWIASDLRNFERKGIALLRSPLARQICRSRIAQKGDFLFSENEANALSDALWEIWQKSSGSPAILRKR